MIREMIGINGMIKVNEYNCAVTHYTLTDGTSFERGDLADVNEEGNIINVGHEASAELAKGFKDMPTQIFPTVSIFKKAVDEWGEVAQIAQMFEEMGELMTAISRLYFRNRKDVSKEDVAEEIADVWIMTKQMIEIFDIHDLVQWCFDFKIEQLTRQLEVGKNFKMDVKTKKGYFR